MFEHILNWKLKIGSHEFPGPDGGTCANEAAIVAAGFKYRAVTVPSDCPVCFSRPITAYVIALNDRILDDELRNSLLMPFVFRLAGTRDKPEIERARAKYLYSQVMHRISRVSIETALEKATEVLGEYSKAQAIVYSHVAYHAAEMATSEMFRVSMSATKSAKIAVEILDGAIKLGNHRRLDISVATSRMEHMKRELVAA